MFIRVGVKRGTEGEREKGGGELGEREFKIVNILRVFQYNQTKV